MRRLDRLRLERTQIMTECRLQIETIDCFYSPIRISFNNNERSCIDKVWSHEVKKNTSVFDGKLFHVKRLELLCPKLNFDTCLSSFKEWVGTKHKKFEKLFGQDKIIKPLSVGSLIVTADNKWIIGRRLKTYDFEDQYNLIAGYMDPDKDLINSKPDPYFALKREIEEEIGVNKVHDISDIICLGLDGTQQPYLAFTTYLNVSYEEMISNIPEGKEFRRFEVYPYERKSIENFIVSNYKEMTPHTLANMLMSSRLLEL